MRAIWRVGGVTLQVAQYRKVGSREVVWQSSLGQALDLRYEITTIGYWLKAKPNKSTGTEEC